MNWGLLEGMGQGMQQAGTNMYEQAKLERINEWKNQDRAADQQFRKEAAEWEQGRADARSQAEIDAKSTQSDLDRQSAEKIAGIRASKQQRPAKQWEPITQKDVDGNVTVVGKFNTVTGARDMFDSSGAPKASLADLLGSKGGAAPLVASDENPSAIDPKPAAPTLPNAQDQGLLEGASLIPSQDLKSEFQQAEDAALNYLRTDESYRDYRQKQAVEAKLQQLAESSPYPEWRNKAKALLNQIQ